MEMKWQTITVTLKTGKVQIFDLCSDPTRYNGLRAYLRDDTRYYDLTTFERGLKNPAVAIVTYAMSPNADIFEFDTMYQASR